MAKKIAIANISSKKQFIIGSIISYIVLALDLIVALFLPKWINFVIGQGNYGVYTLTNALVTMFLVDFGLGAAASKFLTKHVISNDSKSEKNLLGIIYKIYLLIDLIILIIFTTVYFLIEKIYVGLSSEQIILLKTIFPIIAFYNLLNFPFISLDGSLIAHEQFIALKGFSLFQKILYTGLVSLFLIINAGVVFISIAASISGLICLICKFLFCKFHCNLKPNFKFWDKKIAWTILTFSIWITIGTIAIKLIASLLPSILGVVSDARNIAIFGYAYALECNAYSVSTVFSSMLLPNVTRTVENNIDSKNELNKITLKIGRLQCFIISLLFFGFITFGKEFLVLLMGVDYADSYLCFILLFIPNMISACFDAARTVSHVLNTVKYTAIIRISVAITIIALAFLFGHRMGAIGVCLAYFLASIIGELLNVIFVYGFKQKMSIRKISLGILAPQIIPTLVPTILLIIVKRFIGFDSWLLLLGGIALYTLIYLALFYFISLNFVERNQVIRRILRIKRKDDKYPLFDQNTILKCGEKEIALGDERIVFVATTDLELNNYEIVSPSYGSSIAFKNKKNPFFMYLKTNDDFQRNFSGIVICEQDEFDIFKNELQLASKIVILYSSKVTSSKKEGAKEI